VPIDQQNRAGLGQQDSNERREFQTDGKHPKVRKQQLLILIIIIYYYDTRLKFFRDNNIVVKVSTRHPSTHTKKRLEKEKFVQCERERATSYYKLLSHFVSTRIETINILVRKFYETGVCVRVWVGESQ
jgi:hypothetical protein